MKREREALELIVALLADDRVFKGKNATEMRDFMRDIMEIAAKGLQHERIFEEKPDDKTK